MLDACVPSRTTTHCPINEHYFCGYKGKFCTEALGGKDFACLLVWRHYYAGHLRAFLGFNDKRIMLHKDVQWQTSFV